MTSRDVLKILINAFLDYSPARKVLNERYSELISIISNDLEVLEIFKKHIFKSDSSISIILDDLRDFKDFKKIKEWLENDY